MSYTQTTSGFQFDFHQKTVPVLPHSGLESCVLLLTSIRTKAPKYRHTRINPTSTHAHPLCLSLCLSLFAPKLIHTQRQKKKTYYTAYSTYTYTYTHTFSFRQAGSPWSMWSKKPKGSTQKQQPCWASSYACCTLSKPQPRKPGSNSTIYTHNQTAISSLLLLVVVVVVVVVCEVLVLVLVLLARVP